MGLCSILSTFKSRIQHLQYKGCKVIKDSPKGTSILNEIRIYTVREALDEMVRDDISDLQRWRCLAFVVREWGMAEGFDIDHPDLDGILKEPEKKNKENQ